MKPQSIYEGGFLAKEGKMATDSYKNTKIFASFHTQHNSKLIEHL